VPILLAIAAVGTLLEHSSEPLIIIALAVGSASALDVVLLGLRQRRTVLPDGAALTGLLLAMVFSAREPWYVPIVGSAIAIGSKHAFRSLGANIFNPAALALVAVAVVFQSGEDCWGSLPSLGAVGAVAFVVGGAGSQTT
jgi:Na+-translocating ferredoxin:NAD+ oxidoreductase RnfD subunit